MEESRNRVCVCVWIVERKNNGYTFFFFYRGLIAAVECEIDVSVSTLIHNSYCLVL